LILRLLEIGGAVKSRNAYPSVQRSDKKGDLSYNYAFDTEKFKYVALKMVKESGAHILFHTYFSDVIFDSDHLLKGIIIENKSGRQAVFAKIIIDATGDGNVAFKAGVPYWQTKKDEAKRLNDGLMYKIAGFPSETKAPGCLINQHMVVWGPSPGPINAADADELTSAEIETRLRVFEDLEEKKKRWPEDLKGAYVVDTGSLLGIRQTRFFYGEYMLTGEDVLEGRRFWDSIAVAANPVISYFGYRRFLTHEGYTIPYRAILPKKIDNMYVVGRCMSSDQIAFESWRAMAHIMAVGQAAGVAAALCIEDKVLPKKIDVRKLQERLIEQGCEIGQGFRKKGDSQMQDSSETLATGEAADAVHRVVYREMKAGEEWQVYNMVMRCFLEFIAPGYSREGIDNFARYVNPELLLRRTQNGNFVFVAVVDDEIIGTVEVSGNNHIALLFVKKEYHRKGIGKALLNMAIEECKRRNPAVKIVNLNASPYAVKIYERLGFRKIQEEQVKDGIRFTPMEKEV